MNESAIIIDIVILQLNIAAITAGLLTYMRYRKDSLKCFIGIMVSLQAILIRMLIQACIGFAGRGNALLHWTAKSLDMAGTTVLLFALCHFPFYMTGRRPGKMVTATSAIFAMGFLMNALFLSYTKRAIFLTFNKIIVALILIGSFALIITAFGNITVRSRGRAVGYLLGISLIFSRFIFSSPYRGESLLFNESSMGGALPFPMFLMVVCCSGILLIKTYFAVPFFINPESGRLSDYFIEKFNITGRESEIIMELHKGKSYKEIAGELNIAYKTVDAHIQNIYSKTGVNNRKQLVNLIESSSI